MAAQSLKPLPATSIYTLAVIRGLVAVATLLHPTLTCELFGIEMNNGSRILARVFAVREGAFSVLLWWACRRLKDAQRAARSSASAGAREGEGQARENLKLIVWTGLGIDAVDSVSSAVSVWEGSMGGRAVWLVGYGALAFVGVGGVVLRAL